MDFKKLIDEIPAYDHFLTVDEMDASTLKLAEDYPDLVTVTQEGTSRGGHPIYCLKIGDGPKNAVYAKMKRCAANWVIPGI